jgi:hypothetical protein
MRWTGPGRLFRNLLMSTMQLQGRTISPGAPRSSDFSLHSLPEQEAQPPQCLDSLTQLHHI